ncbi:hypothetical protein [Fulvivirga sediminis]|uniref:Uncharacterized protein n=1 Tax=Fulvivirga sediminis TaxID=2803949 RepID=A0A937JYM3_9BACT|nr:hypothetical protein [Fulvivirga sediminis]MBL3655824.1 hypothetical protein [Fulvivirga sediminis]
MVLSRSSKFLFIGIISWIVFISIPSCYWFYTLFSVDSFEDFRAAIISEFQDVYLDNQLDEFFIFEEHYLSVSHQLHIILALFISLIALTCAGIYYLFKKSAPLTFKAQTFSQNQLLLLYALGIAWVGYKAFLFFHFPLHIDEVFDFIYYSKKNLMVRHTYQFNDNVQWLNNHVLYTDLSSLALNLGAGDQLAIRIPSILGEFCLLAMIFLWFANQGFSKAFFITTAVALSFWSGIYSIQGRSYHLLAVFSVASYFCFESYLKDKNSLYLLLGAWVTSMGLATNKMFIIHCCALFIYAIFHIKCFTHKEKVLLLNSVLLASIMTLIFYFPVLLVSGWRNIILHSLSTELLDWTLIHMEILKNISVITNANNKAYLLLMLPLVLFLLFKRHLSSPTTHLFYYFTVQLIMPILFSLIMHTYIPFRSLIYMNVTFTLLTGSMMYDWASRHHSFKLLILTIMIGLLAINTWLNFSYTWLHRIKGYVYDKDFYYALNQELEMVNTINTKQIWIARDLHFHLFYSKLKFPEATKNMDSTYQPQENDVVISADILNNAEVLYTSPIEGAIIQKLK